MAASLRTSEAARPLLKLFFLLDPLLLLTTWLSAHGVPTAMLWSLALVVLTLLLGRVFCGWACPLGTTARPGRLALPPPPRANPAITGRPGNARSIICWPACWRWRSVGGHWGTIFDPLVLLYRTPPPRVLPGIQWAVEDGSTAIFQSDPGVGG